MNKKIKRLVYIAIFSALATFAYAYARFPFMVPFYKIDFSEAIVLIAGYILGPIEAVVVQILKNLLKVLLSGSNSSLIGDLADLLSGLAFIIPAVVIYHRNKTSKSAIIGCAVATIISVVVSCIFNLYVMLPLFATKETIIQIGNAINPNINSMLSFVILITAPFNLVKCLSCSFIVIILLKRFKSLFKNL